MIPKQISCIKQFNEDKNIKLMLFCFHYAGGNASMFSTWHHILPPEIGVYAIQLPGRMNLMHLEPHYQMSTLIPYLMQEISPYLGEKPFCFFGYSLGAMV